VALETLRERIHGLIISGDRKAIKDVVEEALSQGEAPLELINGVLNPALKEVGDRFDCGEMYLPELILSAEAMEAAVAVLQPQLEARQEQVDTPGRVVMATVQGDIHDIGKNIVCALLRANGFKVLDLGRDVPAGQIVRKAVEFEADIIGLSALLSTTLPYCRDTLELLGEKNLKSRFKVFIGGGPVTPEFAEEIGAQYGGAHAEAGVSKMLKAMGRE
jgi:5-methyltetrahydrofolate--homocysteine methyltransferase